MSITIKNCNFTGGMSTTAVAEIAEAVREGNKVLAILAKVLEKESVPCLSINSDFSGESQHELSSL